MNIPHETLYRLNSGTGKDPPETIRLDDGKVIGRRRWRFCFGRCEQLFISVRSGVFSVPSSRDSRSRKLHQRMVYLTVFPELRGWVRIRVWRCCSVSPVISRTSRTSRARGQRVPLWYDCCIDTTTLGSRHLSCHRRPLRADELCF